MSQHFGNFLFDFTLLVRFILIQTKNVFELRFSWLWWFNIQKIGVSFNKMPRFLQISNNALFTFSPSICVNRGNYQCFAIQKLPALGRVSSVEIWYKCSTVVIPLWNLRLQLVSREIHFKDWNYILIVDFTNSYLLNRALKPRSNCLPAEQTNREWKVLY